MVLENSVRNTVHWSMTEGAPVMPPTTWSEEVWSASGTCPAGFSKRRVKRDLPPLFPQNIPAGLGFSDQCF